MRDIEPFEVHQALASSARWPRQAYTDAGLPVLTIWSRTKAGRGLIIVVRPVGPLEWEIVGVRAMRRDESLTFDEWEAAR